MTDPSVDCWSCEIRPQAVGLLCEHCDQVYQDAMRALEDLRAPQPLTRAELDHLDGMRLDAEVWP